MRLLLLSILILLSGCSMFGGQDNTEPPAPLVEFIPTLTLKTVWTADTGGGTDSSELKLAPIVDKGRLFTASPQGHLRAFNLNDGTLLWEQQIDAPISGGPGVGEGLVLLGSQKGDVIARTETDGSQQWRAKVSSEVLSVPRISQGVVVVRTVDEKLFALDSQTGNSLWVYEPARVPLLTLRGTSSPVITDGVIIAGFDNGKIVLLELHTGKVIWEFPVAQPRGRSELERMVDIDAEPLVVDNMIYVTSYQGRTLAIEKNQNLLWERKLSSYAGLGIDADYVYVSDTQSHVWALDRYTGEYWWKQDKLQARNLTAPVSIGNYVVVGDLEGYLHWMRRDNGQFVTRHRIGKASIIVPPLVVDDMLVATNSDGQIVVLRPPPPL